MKLALQILGLLALFEAGVVTVSRCASSSYPSVYPGRIREVVVAQPGNLYLRARAPHLDR